MINLSAKIRKDLGRKNKNFNQKDSLAAVLYGPEIKNLPLELNRKEFEKVYKEAGESSLISLSPEGKKEKFLVLIHEIQLDHLTGKPIHIDFYQPRLKEETEAKIHLVFEGESPAVKELGGTLVKNITEVEVRALPQNLPREIRVNIENLKTFQDHILIKDIKLPPGVKIIKKPEEIVVSLAAPEKVEEELVKPIEEKVEEIEKVEKKKEDKIEEAPEQKEQKEQSKK